MSTNPIRADRRTKMLPLMLTAALLLSAGVALAGERVVAQVDERFEVNGETFDAGRITLREMQPLSPVVMIHEVTIDGRSLGMVMSRAGEAGAEAERDELIFTRGAAGHLVLLGVAFAGEPQRWLTTAPASARAASGQSGVLVASN